MDNTDLKGRIIGRGNTAEVYEWGEDKVLKLFIPGYSEAACRREFAAARYVSERLGIAPRAYEVIRVGDRVGAVYERVFGDTMANQMVRKPWKIAFFARKMASIHAAIHIPVSLEAYGLKDKLANAIDSAAALGEDEKTAVLKHLGTLPDGNAICHFDFHPKNIMISGGRYYVIDWIDGCVGDPLADVARTLLLARHGVSPGLNGAKKLLVGIIQRFVLSHYLREYIRLTGVSAADISRWELPVAAARLSETITQAESQALRLVVSRKGGKLCSHLQTALCPTKKTLSSRKQP